MLGQSQATVLSTSYSTSVIFPPARGSMSMMALFQPRKATLIAKKKESIASGFQHKLSVDKKSFSHLQIDIFSRPKGLPKRRCFQTVVQVFDRFLRVLGPSPFHLGSEQEPRNVLRARSCLPRPRVFKASIFLAHFFASSRRHKQERQQRFTAFTAAAYGYCIFTYDFADSLF